MRLFGYICILWGLSVGVMAAEMFPAGCKPFVIEQETLKLPKTKKALVMVHNIADEEIWITRPAANDPGLAMSFNSQLHKGRWSALVKDTGAFEVNCVESKPGHEQQVACSGVLAVCLWLSPKLPKHTKGYFWAGENLNLSSLMALLGRHGFEPTAS